MSTLEDLTVAHLVHDLRNQLTVMMGCADTLAFLVPRGTADQPIADLRRSAERASALARDILVIARPGGWAPRPVDLNDVVVAARDRIARMAGDPLRVKIHLASEPVRVAARFSELETILVTLVQDGLEAIGPTGTLTVSTACNGEAVPVAKLSVADNGVKARRVGNGGALGSLAVTVGILRGTVSIERSAGAGTAVTVSLPLAAR